MLAKRHIEQIINLVKTNVQFFKLFKRLYSLQFFDFAPRHMQNSDVFEAGADVAEAADHAIVEFEEFERAEDFTGDLEVVELGVDS